MLAATTDEGLCICPLGRTVVQKNSKPVKMATGQSVEIVTLKVFVESLLASFHYSELLKNKQTGELTCCAKDKPGSLLVLLVSKANACIQTLSQERSGGPAASRKEVFQIWQCCHCVPGPVNLSPA